MFRRLILPLFVVVIVAILALTGCTAGPTEKNSLKIGSLPRIFDLTAYVAQQEGLFEEQGIKVEIIPFRSTIEMNAALLAGELDGIIGDIFMVVNLNIEENTSKLVGSCFMPRMFEVVASPESGITHPTELRDKEIATAAGTIMDYALERLLLAEGLNPDDIVKVNVPNMPLRLEMLNQGKVAAAILTPPLSDMAVLNGGRVIVDDIAEPFAGPGLVFSQAALKDKSDAIHRFIQAWQQAVELINTNPEKYRGLLVEIARVPESVSLEVPVFCQLGLPDQTEVESVVNWMIAKEIMSKPITYEKVVETKYLAKR